MQYLYIAIVAVCGATSATSAQRSVWTVHNVLKHNVCIFRFVIPAVTTDVDLA